MTEFASKEAGKKGGKARAMRLSKEERSAIARQAAQARWAAAKGAEPSEASIRALEGTGGKLEDNSGVGRIPEAKYKGFLGIVGHEIPCYVLEGEIRVIGRTSATEALTGIKGGGDLEKYLGVSTFRPFIDLDRIVEGMIPFRLPEVEGLERQAKGISTDLMIDIWRGLVSALEASTREDSEIKLTGRQREMAVKAGMLLAACAKVGLDALVDEATGFQYDRAKNALEVKLRAYLEQEMRKWEKTFPDALWIQFARLTKWKGSVTRRPKYWGKLVMEFIYEYLDPDVAQWLREHAPAPTHGKNYHQWLSSQYGLKKLIEHTWTCIGIASQSDSLDDFRERMRAMFGKGPTQRMLEFREGEPFLPSQNDQGEGGNLPAS